MLEIVTSDFFYRVYASNIHLYSEVVTRKISYRLSTLPPIPDDFMTSLEVNKPQERKVKNEIKTSSPRIPVGSFVKKGISNITVKRKSHYFLSFNTI